MYNVIVAIKLHNAVIYCEYIYHGGIVMEHTKGVLTLSKWGNSLSIRIPKKVLDALKLTNDDKDIYREKDNKNIMTQKKKESPLRKMFDGFDTEAYFKNEPKNKEIDWGKPQGKEIF